MMHEDEDRRIARGIHSVEECQDLGRSLCQCYYKRTAKHVNMQINVCTHTLLFLGKLGQTCSQTDNHRNGLLTKYS